MAILTVRNLPDEVHRALRLRAAQHRRSTEAEMRVVAWLDAQPLETVAVIDPWRER